ncbi:MAG: glycosyltransferase family 4 protein [Clostridia bacterium]|nr:glycosyltransferase family 4 protein [Clostridia bacterium]
MKLLIVADGHYYIDGEDNVYVESVFDYAFYSRYLSAFDGVAAIVRAERVTEPPAGCKKASGEGVEFLPIPPSRGVIQHAKNYIKSMKLIRSYVRGFDCAVFRVPGVTANQAAPVFARTKKPFAAEVVVDPGEYFKKGTVKCFARPLVRIAWTSFLRRICMKANGVSYVTSGYLQSRYPCRAAVRPAPGYFTGSYSSVELPDDSFGAPREFERKDRYVISHAANAFTGYGKGHLTLIDAAKEVVSRGYDIEVRFIGDGPLMDRFKAYAREKGVADRVSFLGRLPSGSAVREAIRQTDMFVFPTKAEGLPRVVLEAMAEGLPVISSPVCGIPEILPAECLVDSGDAAGYADAIIKLISSPELMTEHGARNMEKAREFRSSVLNARRKAFYEQLRALAEEKKE